MAIELQIADGVATLTINRPDRKNAFTMPMRETFALHLERLAKDTEVRAIILTGAGDSFCSGMDVDEMGNNDVAAMRQRLALLHRMIRAIGHIDKPVIAAVRGVAVGAGWSLALSCDIVIAAESARFAQVFKNVGLAPDGAAAFYLQRLLGLARAKELVFSGRWVNADEALALGLVQQVVPDGQLLDAARTLGRSYADSAALALGIAKRMFEVAAGSSLDQFLDFEMQAQTTLSQTRDHREGAAAFREKRKPQFRGC